MSSWMVVYVVGVAMGGGRNGVAGIKVQTVQFCRNEEKAHLGICAIHQKGWFEHGHLKKLSIWLGTCS